MASDAAGTANQAAETANQDLRQRPPGQRHPRLRNRRRMPPPV
jgi:hypothetical protein